MNSFWRASLVLLFALPGAAFGQQPSTSPAPSTPAPSPSSSSSFPAHAEPASFDSLDTNHDGLLSKDEFMALFSNSSSGNGYGGRGGHHGQGGRGYGGGANPNGGGFGGGGFGGHSGGGFGGHPPGGGFGGHPPGGAGGAYGGGQHHGGGARGERLNPTQQFEDLDTNHDGMLSREEFAARTPDGGVSSNGGKTTGTAATTKTSDANSAPTN